jgi:hypothetical protein
MSSSVAPRVRVSSATTASDFVFLFGLRAARAAAVRAPFAGASASGVVPGSLFCSLMSLLRRRDGIAAPTKAPQIARIAGVLSD